MKNYAGHRLSPWLGHLMVSRQETSRPLLTPGEVMQLPPNEAIVMVSGVHPVRARKVRYYEDAQFQSRILKPSRAVPINFEARPDEWSGHAPIPPSVKLLAAPTKRVRDQNGGIRREAELPQHEEVALKAPLTENEFDAGPDEGDADANFDRLQGLLEALQGPEGSGQLFVSNAETLVLIATSHFELSEAGYGLSLIHI